MELKLTTKRALQFEERTGKDVLTLLEETVKSNSVTVKDIVQLFISCGEGYTMEMFDQWDATFVEKSEAILQAVAEYLGTGTKK